MSDFKAGDKVYLECEVLEKDMSDNTYELIYKNWHGDEFPTDFVRNDVLHPTDESYNKGLNDAWELAKKIAVLEDDGGYSCEELENIFGHVATASVLKVFTPQEALAKVKAYEDERNEIKVGDVVKARGGWIESIVTKVDGYIIYRLFRDGSCSFHTDFKEDFVKTGHFDSIDEFMRSTDD